MEKRKGCERKYGKGISKKRSKSARVASESVGEKKIETVFPQSARLYLQSAREICSKKTRRSCVFIYNIYKNLCIICFSSGDCLFPKGERVREIPKEEEEEISPT